MRSSVQSIQAQAEAQARELLQAIEAAESVIISTIERECEALRAGRTLAANALRLRLRDGARLYLNLARAARASMRTFNLILPGAGEVLEERLRALAAEMEIGAGKLIHPLRVALTGNMASPGIFDVLVLLGRDRGTARIDGGLERIRSM